MCLIIKRGKMNSEDIMKFLWRLARKKNVLCGKDELWMGIMMMQGKLFFFLLVKFCRTSFDKKRRNHSSSWFQEDQSRNWESLGQLHHSFSVVKLLRNNLLLRFSPYEWEIPHPCIKDSEGILINQFSLLNSLWFTIGE